MKNSSGAVGSNSDKTIQNALAIWVAISVIGLFASVMFDMSNRTIAIFTLSLLLAGLSATDSWGGIGDWFGEVLSGEYGGAAALFLLAVISFLAGALFHFINPGEIFEIVDDGGLISALFGNKPIESILIAVGWILLFVSAIVLTWDKVMK